MIEEMSAYEGYAEELPRQRSALVDPGCVKRPLLPKHAMIPLLNRRG